MTYLEFIKKLEKGDLHPAYVFAGTEQYLVDDCLKRLSEKVVEPSTREFNYDVFYASQIDAGRIIDAACAYPMLADARMVVVKELHKLSPSGLTAIGQYLEKPSATTRLVLITEKFSAKNKAYKQIKDKSCFVELKPLYDNQIPDWIKNLLKRQGYEISYNACLLIQAHVGNSLLNIANEIEKIKLNVESKKIDESDVQRVVGLSKKFSVFDLNDALGNRQVEKSLSILNKMLDSGESPTAILAMVTRHFMNLLKVKGAVAQNKSPNEITALTGIPPFFIKKTKAMASQYPAEQFSTVFSCLLEADLNLKTSQQPPKIALQTTLLKILN